VLEVDLHQLEPGRSELVLDDELALSPDEGAERCDLRGVLAVDTMDQKVLVHGTFQVERQMACHRCDRPSRQVYPAEIEVLILRHPRRGRDPEPAGDAWVIQQQAGVVQLAVPLVEAVVLHEPQRILCKEDCRGLCPQCGIDRNESTCDCRTDSLDSRWEALRKLKDDTGESQE
jgi:uncharacterized protein